MIRGYRWIKTGPDVWLYEGPSGSRRFHGMVNCHRGGPYTYCVPGGYTVTRTRGPNGWYGEHQEHGQGERATLREAKDEVERHVRAGGRDGKA